MQGVERPEIIKDSNYRFDSFKSGEVLPGKKKDRLPAMGWNSWNAFGSGNTEALTKAMADRIVELELDKCGYRYVVLDDGCYKPERIDGLLSNEEVKFPSGFKALGDYIHAKGLKFGMYNDIGTNLCAGAAVGTCGHEETDTKSYFDWGVDFIKVDNCYYLWDNATFSDAENARHTYAPNIKGIAVKGTGENSGFETGLGAADGWLVGKGAEIRKSEAGDEYITGLGTFDGTGPEHSPVGDLSAEAIFKVCAPAEGEYELTVKYAIGREPGVGEWLQAAVGEGADSKIFYDDFLEGTEGKEVFKESLPIRITLKTGDNTIRLMNHRRQENTLCSYGALHKGFLKADPGRDIVLSICEWGKTQPQNWGYKVGDSWRILNDITFQVGSDGNPGRGAWTGDYTTSVCAQYNKAVIMDEFAGLKRGWNDPDMLMIGMDGLDMTMCKTHFTMWSMMNSPLMLGLDLRRVSKGDGIYNIITNGNIISLNQDPLGIQAKRIYTTYEEKEEWDNELCRPDKAYIRDNDRVDVLAKPLYDGTIALSFINLSDNRLEKPISVDKYRVVCYLEDKMKNPSEFRNAKGCELRELWTGEVKRIEGESFTVENIEAHDNITYIVKAL
ncbi:MAG: glycoside hydrolase family 27 protein [Lachnospiraceae bacterium]|nr:glycoside hydrolase family 27 protein [Lachnospiraceae bacterium]